MYHDGLKIHDETDLCDGNNIQELYEKIPIGVGCIFLNNS